MGGEEVSTKKRKESTPPEGYVCRLCSTPGHWIQVCPTKKTGTKRQRKSDHVPVPGKDPSEEDIEKARELQKIPPPKCFCGLPSRLNKVKRSKEGGDGSRAIGKYFYFCSKKRDDETQCRYARPVELELKKQKSGGGEKPNAKAGGMKEKKGRDEKGAEKTTKKQLVCKFFAKNGSCKKGNKCEFSHDTATKKQPEKSKETRKTRLANEKEDDDSSSDSSSSESSGDGDNEKKANEGADDGSSSSLDDSSSGDESE